MLKTIRHKSKFIEKPKPSTTPLKTIKPAGVLYIAYGDRARAGVVASVKSLHSIHPGMRTAVITDRQLPGVDVQIIHPEKDLGAREYKTQAYNYSPFELTLQLDADTVIVGSLQAGFEALQAGWDMAVALDFRPIVSGIDHLPAEDVKMTMTMLGTGEYPHYNSGMIFYRKNAEVEHFYWIWHNEWNRMKHRDQGAFVRAFHQSDVKLWVLAPQWNIHKKDRATHIWHNHHSVDRTLKREAQ